jgi:D-alanine-D-alanine ligase
VEEQNMTVTKDITVLLSSDLDDPYQTDFSFMCDYVIHFIHVTIDSYVDLINQIPAHHFIINLCDGCQELGTAGIEVIQYLEQQLRVFTGASSRNYLWSKADIKRYNVQSPPYLLINRDNYAEINYDNILIPYPLFVKPNNCMGGSEGILRESKVHNSAELHKVVDTSLRLFEEVIVEQFIDGREFTILAIQSIQSEMPIILEPLECVFQSGETFKHYELKWYQYHKLSYIPVSDQQLFKQLNNFAQKAFITMKIDGYVRFDIRMDHKGELYLLDVNPYCAMFYHKDAYGSADMILEKSRIMNHYTFVKHLLECAKYRYKNLILSKCVE